MKCLLLFVSLLTVPFLTTQAQDDLSRAERLAKIFSDSSDLALEAEFKQEGITVSNRGAILYVGDYSRAQLQQAQNLLNQVLKLKGISERLKAAASYELNYVAREYFCTQLPKLSRPAHQRFKGYVFDVQNSTEAIKVIWALWALDDIWDNHLTPKERSTFKEMGCNALKVARKKYSRDAYVIDYIKLLQSKDRLSCTKLY